MFRSPRFDAACIKKTIPDLMHFLLCRLSVHVCSNIARLNAIFSWCTFRLTTIRFVSLLSTFLSPSLMLFDWFFLLPCGSCFHLCPDLFCSLFLYLDFSFDFFFVLFYFVPLLCPLICFPLPFWCAFALCSL